MVAVFAREKVNSRNFGYDKFDIESRLKLFILSQFEYRLFKMVVGRNSRNYNICILTCPVDQGFDEFRGLISK